MEMDLSRSQLANRGGTVELVDPQFPFTVLVSMDASAQRPTITELSVTSRQGEPITSAVISQIPLRQIAGVAASVLTDQGEAHFRMLAKRVTGDVRAWPREHWEHVARVVTWAIRTGRRGGGALAVAEFWGVHPRTARRWILRLRRMSLLS